MIQMNLFAKRNRDIDEENGHMVIKGRQVKWDELGDWDCMYIYIDAMYEVNNSWESTLSPREPYSLLYRNLHGKEIQKREDIYI